MALEQFLEGDLDYASHYCEENIYRLALKYCAEVAHNAHNAFVIFVSNKLKQVPIWNQQLADSPDEPVVWDYHVILYVREEDGGARYIVDFDSVLGLATTFLKYAKHAFRPECILDNRYKQLFRVVPAVDFINNFASDRSHMIDAEKTQALAAAADWDGKVAYTFPLPPWEAIRGVQCDTAMNLDGYISMEDDPDATKYGTVYSFGELVRANL